MSTGMNAFTGEPLTGTAHLQQSVRDILTTRPGTRIMEPDYGSDIPALIDAGITRDSMVDIYVAVAASLKKWEPRISVKRVRVAEITPGATVIDIDAVQLVDGKPLNMEGLTL